MDISKHLPGDTFTQTVKGRIRDQHPLPGWELWDECLWCKGCIYIPKPLCLQLIHNHHDHPTVGHFGHHKTINLICCLYHWLGLTRVVKQYIWSCMVCARSKANWHKLYGFLKQLPIPPHPWELMGCIQDWEHMQCLGACRAPTYLQGVTQGEQVPAECLSRSVIMYKSKYIHRGTLPE